jgi:hypothetical protein
MSPPATWNPQPNSQRMIRIAKIVQSIGMVTKAPQEIGVVPGRTAETLRELSPKLLMDRNYTQAASSRSRMDVASS